MTHVFGNEFSIGTVMQLVWLDSFQLWGLMNMKKPSPLEILMKEFVPAAEITAIETEVAKVHEPPAVKSLGEMRTPVYGNDPNELLKHRFHAIHPQDPQEL